MPPDTPPPTRLRANPLDRPFRIALVEPEIPPNTGNIARLTAATASELHLIGKLGFRIDAHAVRRAGVDYWHLVNLHEHTDFDAFFASLGDTPRVHLFTAHAPVSYLDGGYQPGDALVFGRESVGLPPELCRRYETRTRAIPTLGPVRSLNLANAVSIVLYEALRAVGALTPTFVG